jgi:hypothetical protein
MDDEDDGQDSRAPTIEDLARVCDSLNRSEAQYVLIGGFAVIAHGAGRTTKDIDFLIDPSPENVARVKTALSVLPDNAGALIADTDVETYKVVRVADEVVIDLMGSACGVSYQDAVKDAEVLEIERIHVPVASKQTLIRTKETIRPSDQIDREFLAALIREEDAEERSRR